ncbi:uncharacterized protein LOC141815057 isoform X2 [Curcuma longa]|uniref:uncharacterized protein LOC141815057 isoform X2 n=1 Tax=Curcuma longa TaxID=136217 RepID=UPI003D9F5513
MARSETLRSYFRASAFDSGEIWPESAGGGWATAIVTLLLVSWQLLRLFYSRRIQRASCAQGSLIASSGGGSSSGVSEIISDADLRDLMISLDSNLEGDDRWEHVIDRSNDLVSYKAKCYRLKDEPLKYHSVTTFENCSTELLRDFYMDNEYRKVWDRILIQHKQLQVDEDSGIEIGCSLKKFPLLTPREYVLAWRIWEGKDKTFYCLIKECEHPLAPRQKKYVRVRFYRSGWRIRQVPGRDACEITVVHQEDAGLNVEMAKLTFAKGIWSFVCKTNSALRGYSSHPSRSVLVPALLRLIKKVPSDLEPSDETRIQETRQSEVDIPKTKSISTSTKWIANGLLVAGGIIFLSRGRGTLGAQLAAVCMLNKFRHHGAESDQVDHTRPRPDRRKAQHVG